MVEKMLTPAQYAKTRNVSTVAVTRAMKGGKQLIGVKSYKKIGRDWFLSVINNDSKKNIGKCVVIQK